MRGLGESIFKEGWEEGFRQGRKEGRELERDKIIRNLICYDLKDHVSADCIIQKIQNYFDVSRERLNSTFRNSHDNSQTAFLSDWKISRQEI